MTISPVNDLAVTSPAGSAGPAMGLTTQRAERIQRYVLRAKAPNTVKAYQALWRAFEAWCNTQGYDSLPAPAPVVADYITTLADRGARVATIQSALAAIAYIHATRKLGNPTRDVDVKETMKGIRRTLTVAPHQKEAITLDKLRLMIAACPGTGLRALRNRALLLIGYAGAFRRSELVQMRVEDIHFNQVKASITLPRSKTDQEGAGMLKSIPILEDKALCPVTALRAWLDAAQINAGVVFRPIDRWGHCHNRQMDGREVARIVKLTAQAAGIDPRHIAGHSLRAGYVTACAEAGVPTYMIAKQTGHAAGSRVIEAYIRNADTTALEATRAALGVPK